MLRAGWVTRHWPLGGGWGPERHLTRCEGDQIWTVGFISQWIPTVGQNRDEHSSPKPEPEWSLVRREPLSPSGSGQTRERCGVRLGGGFRADFLEEACLLRVSYSKASSSAMCPVLGAGCTIRPRALSSEAKTASDPNSAKPARMLFHQHPPKSQTFRRASFYVCFI